MLLDADGRCLEEDRLLTYVSAYKPLFVHCDTHADAYICVPTDKVAHFWETTCSQDAYPAWLDELGWYMLVMPSGSVGDLCPACAAINDEAIRWRKHRDSVRVEMSSVTNES